MSIEHYAKTTLFTNKQVDSFFMLGVACKFTTHMALIHLDGTWTMHGDGAFQEGDLMLAQTTDGLREVLKIKDDVSIYDTLLAMHPALTLCGLINPQDSQLQFQTQ